MFYGFVFTKSRKANSVTIDVVAYDQLRYLKNKDTITEEGLKLSLIHISVYLKNNNHIVKINNQLHIYRDGIYVPGAMEIEMCIRDRFCAAVAKKLFGSTTHAKKVLGEVVQVK